MNSSAQIRHVADSLESQCLHREALKLYEIALQVHRMERTLDEIVADAQEDDDLQRAGRETGVVVAFRRRR